jgi:hypothetical protein
MSDSASGEPLAVAARYDTEEDARRAVETLLLRGVGAMSEHREGGGPSHVVLVVPEETRHASEILGLPDPGEPDVPPARRPQLVWILAVFGAALIILPLLAFLLSFKLAGG